MPPFAITAAAVAALILPALCAQDTRTVTEPHFPASCAVLTAQLTSDRGVLPAPSENTPDTARIQAAIDSCEKGKAVTLRSSGAKNIFLTGPITLRPGVTLLVQSGVALFASPQSPRL
jgi:polygalacturonase